MFNRTVTLFWKKQPKLPMTVIEIRPYRNGWQVNESPGVHPTCLGARKNRQVAATLA
jgi:hypothetical protein